MNKGDKFLGWGALLLGAGFSLWANVRSIYLPSRQGVSVEAWRALAEVASPDAGAFAVALVAPLFALVAIEMASKFKHLSGWLRFGVVGLVAFAAAATSFTHIMSVLTWYGQPVVLAVLLTVAIDGLMIMSTVALFSVRPATDMDSGQVVPVSEIADTIADMVADIPLSTDTDTAPDTVPDMDTLPVAPVDIIRQRRPQADKAWKADATEMIRNGDPSTDQGIADKILANEPGTWSTPEAGRKAVSRLRANL